MGMYIGGASSTLTISAISSTVDVNLSSSRSEEYKFKRISTATSTLVNVWTPSSGKCVHISSLITSCSDNNSVAWIFNNSTLCFLDFNEKKAVPISIPFELCGGIDEPLKVSIASSGTVSVTAIGHEQ